MHSRMRNKQARAKLVVGSMTLLRTMTHRPAGGQPAPVQRHPNVEYDILDPANHQLPDWTGPMGRVCFSSERQAPKNTEWDSQRVKTGRWPTERSFLRVFIHRAEGAPLCFGLFWQPRCSWKSNCRHSRPACAPRRACSRYSCWWSRSWKWRQKPSSLACSRAPPKRSSFDFSSMTLQRIYIQ